MFGFVTAITAADAAAKAADVKVIAIDSNKPANADSVEVPLIMAVKVQGSVSAVTAAVDAAARTAESISGLINKHIIARPTDDSQKMANRTSVGRDKVARASTGTTCSSSTTTCWRAVWWCFARRSTISAFPRSSRRSSIASTPSIRSFTRGFRVAALKDAHHGFDMDKQADSPHFTLG